MSILLTRPEPQIKNSSSSLINKGFSVFEAPMLVCEALDFSVGDLERYTVLIFTSQVAVRVLSQSYKSQISEYKGKVYCVGDKTADFAENSGFKDVVSAGGDVQDLCTLMDTDFPNKSILNHRFIYFRAEDISYDLSAYFQGRGSVLDEVAIYRMNTVKTLEADIQKAVKDGAITHALFYSVRTAQAFIDAVRHVGLDDSLNQIKALSISAAVLGCLQSLDWGDIKVANEPTETALFSLL